MIWNYSFIISAIFLTLGACKQNNEIKTYRLAKESAPLLAPAESFQSNPASNSMPELPGMAPAASSRDIQWKVPKDWIQQPPSSMRVGSFLIKGSNGQMADVSVIPLSGMAGGDLANINRWRDQIALPPLSESDLPDVVQQIKVNGKSVSVVNFVSDKPLIEGQFKKRVLAATIPQNERTWFFKMTGEDKTVQSAKQQFIDFLTSVQFE